MTFIIFLIFTTMDAFSDVRVENGFFLIRGEPHEAKDTIEESDVLFCKSFCRLISSDTTLSFTFSGFNTLKNISLLTKSVEQLKNFKTLSMRVTIESSEESIEQAMDIPNSIEEKETEDSNKTTSLAKESLNNPSIQYTYPYPPNKTVFLHQNGGKIYFVPKAICQSECVGFVNSVDSKDSQRITFQTGERPYWSFTVPTFLEKSKYQWSFQDGDEKHSYEFFIFKNNQENFQEALNVGSSVEVMH